jgi:hypothetical protein
VETVQDTVPGANFPIFDTSATLYPIGGLGPTGRYYENMGIRLNATYRIASDDDDGKPEVGTTLRMRFRSHICDTTGGVVQYKAQLAAQAITLISNNSNDQVLKDL